MYEGDKPAYKHENSLLRAEIKRLRTALDNILTLDGRNDLPDAWKIAGDALRGKDQ